MSITTSPAATVQAWASVSYAAHAILQPGIKWHSAAGMLESCTIAFWPKESEPLLPMIRRILGYEFIVRELLKASQENVGRPDEWLYSGCLRLLEAARRQQELRNVCRFLRQ